MAGRVNKKFVFGLSAVLLLMVGGLVGFFYTFVYQDPATMIAKGDIYRDDGKFQLAVENYGKALRRRPSDLDLIDKYIATLKQAPVTEPLDTRKYLGQIIEWSRQATELRPNDPQRFERLYSFMLDMAEQQTGTNGYNQLYALASKNLNSDPNNLVTRKYRGVAQVHRYATGLAIDDWKQALADLTLVYEKHPDDALVAHNIALWQLQEARRVHALGGLKNLDDAKTLRAQAIKLSSQTLAQKPDDPDRMIDHVRVLLAQGVDDTEAAAPILKRLEQSLLKDPHPVAQVSAVASLLPKVDKQPVEQADPDKPTTRGMLRARKMLSTALKADPGTVVYLVMLGGIDRQQGREDQAIAEFRQAREVKTPGTALQSLRARGLQRQASFQLGNLLLAKADKAKGEDRAKQLDQVSEIAEQLAGDAGDGAAVVNLLRGKLALERQNYEQATVYLDRASSQYQDTNPQVLLLSARARQATHEWGAAAQRLETLLQLRPGLLPVHRELARIYLKNNDLSKAQGQLQIVLNQNPKDPKALTYQANLLARQGRIDQAITAYKDLDPTQNPKLALTLAALYAQKGDRDQAQSLLRQRLKQSPNDFATLQMLLRLTKNPKQQRAVLDQAKKAGASENILNLLRLSIGGQDAESRDQLVQSILDKQSDPLKRALTTARLSLGQGKRDKARQALEQAAKIDAGNPDVIQMRFAMALQDKRFEQAQQLVDQAANQNLDAANGVFFRARLYAAKGDMASAIAAMRQGLQTRPVYSQGWRMLGDMLVRSKDTAGAIDAYKRAVDQQPDNLEALRGLARAYIRENQTQDALNALRRAYQFHPDNAEVRNIFLTFQSEHGDPEAALAGWRQAVKRDPDNANVRRGLVLQLNRMGENDQALVAAHELIDRTGKTRQNVTVLARIQQAAGRGDQGLQTLQDYLARQGDKLDMNDRLLIPRYQLASNHLSQAVQAYRQAATHENPKQRRATRELADALFQRQFNDQALSLYQDLRRTSPDDQSVTLRLAEALVRLKKDDQATKVLASLPQEAPTANMLRALVAGQKGDLDQAKQTLDAMISRDGDNALFHYQRARVELARNPRSRDAEADLARALVLDPSMGQARVAQAQLLSNRGRWNQAIDVLQNELSRSPNNLSARLHLINAYAYAHDTQAARQLARDSQTKYGDSPVWPRVLGQIAVDQNRFDQAVTHWRRAVELAPTAQDIASLADALLRDKQVDAALGVLRDHATLMDRQPVLQAVRARALAAKGRDDQARRAFTLALGRCVNASQVHTVASQMVLAYPAKQVVAMMPRSDDSARAAWMDMTAAQLLLQDRQFKLAAARAQTALEALPDQGQDAQRIQANRTIATASYQAKDYEPARQAYQRLLSLAPQDISALNNFAYMLAADLNDPAAGMEYARQAVQLSNDNAKVLDTLGYCQLLSGDLNGAQATLQRSLQRQTFAANSYHMAQVFHQQGRAGQAEQWIQRAIDLAGETNDQDTLQKAQTLRKQL